MQFALISHPRCGTTFFRDMLNASSSVFCYGEVFFPDYFHWGFYSFMMERARKNPDLALPSNWAPVLKDYFNQLTGVMSEAKKEHVGFDIKIPQMQSIYNISGFLYKNNFGVVHLRRRNVVEAIVSLEIMAANEASGIPVHSGTKPPLRSIHVDRDWLLQRIDELNFYDDQINRIFSSVRYIEIYYEDLVDQERRSLVQRRLGDFFNANIALQDTIYVKQGYSLSDTVTNYAEIADICDSLLVETV